MIQYRQLRWTGHMIRMGEERTLFRTLMCLYYLKRGQWEGQDFGGWTI